MTQSRKSGIGVWFKEEIENTICAVDLANKDVAQHIVTPEMQMYRLGYEAAIEALATAFGVKYTRTTPAPLSAASRANGAAQF